MQSGPRDLFRSIDTESARGQAKHTRREVRSHRPWRPRNCRWFSRVAVSPDQCGRSEEHTSELQSHSDLVCRLLLEKKKKNNNLSIRVRFILIISLSHITLFNFTYYDT